MGKSFIKNINENQLAYYIKNSNDKTMINYLALLNAIIDKNPDKNANKYLIKELFDKEEEKKRMKQIDYLRAIGAGTELDHEKWMEDFKKRCEKNNVQYRRIPIEVINKHAGTKETFRSIREACEAYDLKLQNVRGYFNYRKTREIQYKGLIIRKI